MVADNGLLNAYADVPFKKHIIMVSYVYVQYTLYS